MARASTCTCATTPGASRGARSSRAPRGTGASPSCRVSLRARPSWTRAVSCSTTRSASAPEAADPPGPEPDPMLDALLRYSLKNRIAPFFLARQQVLERMGQAELPEGVQPSLGPLATPIGEVYRYTLEGKGADPMSLRTQQDWVVRPQLLRVPGVADVVSYGGLLREIHVEPDPVRMAALEVGLSDIFEALKKASDNASGGYVERGSEMFVIRSLGIFKDLPDIEQVRVGSKGGVPVAVKDVARVGAGFAPRQGIVSREADEDAVEGIVLMRRGENPSVVLKSLRERIDDLNQRVLPQGTRIHPFYDRTELVDTTLRTVFRNLAEGAFLVVLVLFLFMLSVKASLIVAAVIPLSLLTSFLYLYLRGMSANLLSMGAVDFGIIVEDRKSTRLNSSH